MVFAKSAASVGFFAADDTPFICTRCRVGRMVQHAIAEQYYYYYTIILLYYYTILECNGESDSLTCKQLSAHNFTRNRIRS